MPKINVLSEIVASQVAAGEVVERPASVVKELVENSVDSGATKIEVRIQRGGVSLIRVVDNGCGMNHDDALLSLERHATSKIKNTDDLGAIRTLGFRGEALPSISSVSRFSLITREADAIAGTEVTVDGGRVKEVRASGSPPGTQVEVRTLFFNVPARRKFLRTEHTEFSHIEQHLRLQAIAHPEINFTLLHNERLVFQLPATHLLIERIEGLIGPETVARLIKIPDIQQDSQGVGLSGFVSEPGFGRSNRTLQLSFLNDRPVESPVITHGLRNGYHGALAKGQYPLSFLFLTMDPADVDVNVHPAKKEVRFLDGNTVQATITTAVMRALKENRRAELDRAPAKAAPPRPEPALPPGDVEEASVDLPTLPASAPQPQLQPQPQPEPAPAQGPKPVWAEQTTQPELLKPATPPPSPQEPQPKQEERPVEPNTVPSPEDSPEENAPTYRLIGILGRTYAVLEGEDGLVLMDQSASHERVLFEQARKRQHEDAAPASQGLLIPLTLQLSPREFDFVRQNLRAIQELGFGIEEFGANTLKVDSLPTFCEVADPQAFLNMVFEGMHQLSGSRSRLSDEAIANAVCRQAVRQRDSLTEHEIHGLVKDLLACDMPYCCPNGNPTLIQISWSELARKFGKQV
jgi:DNA mismatch repair protein MutL